MTSPPAPYPYVPPHGQGAFAQPPMLPARERTRQSLRAVTYIAAGMVFFVAAGILLLLILASAGPQGLLVGVLLAPLPAAAVVAALLWLDRWEPEPPPLLVGLFLWGALIAALVAATINTAAQLAVMAVRGPEEAAITTAVFVAPVVEEIAKAAGLLLVVWWHRRHFDGVLDGLITAGIVGAGFAFTENILYFGTAYLEGAEAGNPGVATLFVFVARGIFSPFAHSLFGAFFGIALGWAVTTRHRSPLRGLVPVAGLLAAVLLHGLWNSSAVATDRFLGVYVAVMVPLFLLMVSLGVAMRYREGRILRRALPTYARTGWIPPNDLPMLTSLSRRRQARRWAGRQLGPPGRRAMDAYQEAAGELAFLRDRAERLRVEAHFAAREHTLLATLRASREALAPALDGGVPPALSARQASGPPIPRGGRD